MALISELTKFTTASPLTATFSFTEVAEATGIQIYYGILSNKTGGDEYHLIGDSSAWSATPTTTRTSSGTTTITFDSKPFQLSRTARGTAAISCGFYKGAGGNANITAEVFHVTSGDVATSIGSKITGAAESTNGAHMQYLEIPLTEKVFAQTDRLRITIELTLASTGEIEFGHDPAGQDGTNLTPSSQNATSTMRFYMSYKVE